MNPSEFKRELEKYPVVRRADYMRPRNTRDKSLHKSELPKQNTNQVMKSLEEQRDWLSLIETASKKIIDRGAHAKFMTELRKEHARVGRLVNLEILEEFASKELPQA